MDLLKLTLWCWDPSFCGSLMLCSLSLHTNPPGGAIPGQRPSRLSEKGSTSVRAAFSTACRKAAHQLSDGDPCSTWVTVHTHWVCWHGLGRVNPRYHHACFCLEAGCWAAAGAISSPVIPRGIHTHLFLGFHRAAFGLLLWKMTFIFFIPQPKAPACLTWGQHMVSWAPAPSPLGVFSAKKGP